MQYWKRFSLLVLSSIMAFSISGCGSNKEEEQKKFDEFINDEFVNTMENDYTTAHVFMEHPENFGVDITDLEVNLGDRLDMESQKEAVEEANATWDEFQKFNRGKLSDEQKDTYDIFEYQNRIDHQLNDEKFAYYSQLFESMTGLHYQLPTLFADWILRNEQDVKDLILLIKDVQPYIASAISYTKTQADMGLLMTDIDSVKEYCDGILETGENSSVLTSMKEHIEELNLDEEKNIQYEQELKDAFISSFLPAYQEISTLMQDLKNGKNNEEGYAKFEYGKEYYELLSQANIGSDKSIDDVKKMMQKDLNKRLSNLAILLMDSNVSQAFSKGLPTTKYDSYDAILDDIRSHLENDFPKISSLQYNIININEEIASSGVAAYFNVPPLDGDGIKQLRVNPTAGDMNEIATFQTVAHEGFPGHMYQYGFMYDTLRSSYRKTLANSLAYTEGYAVYAQFYAYKYLKDIDSTILEAMQENELISYDIIVLADIGIHYEGWSFSQFTKFMSDNGFTLNDEEMLANFKQLQANPCTFQPYYVGYYEIIALKEKAQDELGEKFEDVAFHEALLKSGNAPFHVVERNIDAYIDSIQ